MGDRPIAGWNLQGFSDGNKIGVEYASAGFTDDFDASCTEIKLGQGGWSGGATPEEAGSTVTDAQAIKSTELVG